MPSGIEVAKAYVTIIPKSDGTSNDVITSIVDPINDAVGESGTKAGGLFNTNLGAVLGKFAVPAALGTALVGIGKLGYDAFSEVEEGTVNLITATGATGDAAKELQDVYENVASNVVGSFADIGAAVGEVNTRFGVSGDELQGLSEQYMKFAKVNGTDVVNSIDQTQKALTAFGLDASAAPAMLDAMTKAGQNTGVSMETLQNGLVQNAAAFQELGMDVESSISFMSQLEMSGANSTTVMSGLRKAMKNAAADGVPLDEALAQLQETIQNGDESMDGLTAAYELFGKSGDQVYAAVKNGSLDFNSLTKSMEGTDGALDDVYNNTLTASEKMDLAMQNIKLAGADLFAPVMESVSTVLTGTVIPLVQNAGAKISEFMTNVSTWYNANIAPVVDEVSAVVVPVVQDVANKVEDGIGKVGDVVAEVMPYIRQAVQIAWPVIQKVITAAVGVIKAVVPPVFNTIRNIISTAMSAISAIVRTVWPMISRTISTAVKTIKTVIGGISSVVGRVRSAFNSIKSAMTNPIQTAQNTIRGTINRIKGFFPLHIGKIFSGLQLPHISVSGGSAPFGIGGKGSLPHFDVNWYAKAAQQPYVFDRPTLFGAGDVKDEMLYGRTNLLRDIKEATAGNTGTVQNTFNFYVNGTENPEQWASRAMRQLKMEVRMA